MDKGTSVELTLQIAWLLGASLFIANDNETFINA